MNSEPKSTLEGTILVVDDMPVNVKILSTKLTAAGYECLKAYGGEEAVKIARESNPDIILLDIMMPGMDGYEVTRILKGDPATSIIPIVMVTALEGVEDKVKGLDAGADDFLTKPPNQTELIARVRSLIKLKRLQQEAEIRSTHDDPQPRTGLSNADGNKGSILIIEDDVKTSSLWSRVLASNYNCITAKSGEEGLEAMDKEIPDLVLLDLLLPDMHGLDLLKRVKKNPVMEEISVIIVSSINDLETRVKGIDLGSDDYLVKPVNALEMLARVRAAIRKTHARKKLKQTLNEVFKLSITDSLTGLYNRQYFNSYLEKLMASSRRHSRKFSLLFVDIDRFKAVNDKFGHLIGDNVLKNMADIFEDNLRASDVIARFGGEEFVILLSDTDLKGGEALAEKLRTDVEAFDFDGLEKNSITVSVGVSESSEVDGSITDILKRADDALYRAKEDGRNKVETG
ncbi:MAG: response regulator [Thermodesulfobacteriota bacterium]